MKSKPIVAAAALLMLVGGLAAFLLLKPKEQPAPPPDKPRVVKPPMLRAPPREDFGIAPKPPAPAPVAAAADASVPPEPAAPALADPNAVARPLTGPMNHHPPPPHSAGARFLAIETRYQKAKEAWIQLRSHKSPQDQQRYDALLEQAGKELSAGSRQAGAQHLQEFVVNALDGVEP